MTYPAEMVERVGALLEEGLSQAEISRRTGVARSAIRQWRAEGPANLACRREMQIHEPHLAGACSVPLEDSRAPIYAYLLAMYLGDGYIARQPNGVFRLRISLDKRYPMIIGECVRAMRAVLPNRVSVQRRVGCVEVGQFSKHWPCLFPQHGPGMKHTRPIVLEDWQRNIAIESFPGLFLRGLIHSDGCRITNSVKKSGRVYTYPRYFFTNESDDIRRLFGEACDAIGAAWRPSKRNTISVARHEAVARLDWFVGPKR